MEYLTFLIINDLPEEFGECDVISGHNNHKDAMFMLSLYKGYRAEDSYSHQYYKVISRKKLKKLYPHLEKGI